MSKRETKNQRNYHINETRGSCVGGWNEKKFGSVSFRTYRVEHCALFKLIERNYFWDFFFFLNSLISKSFEDDSLGKSWKKEIGIRIVFCKNKEKWRKMAATTFNNNELSGHLFPSEQYYEPNNIQFYTQLYPVHQQQPLESKFHVKNFPKKRFFWRISSHCDRNEGKKMPLYQHSLRSWSTKCYLRIVRLCDAHKKTNLRLKDVNN